MGITHGVGGVVPMNQPASPTQQQQQQPASSPPPPPTPQQQHLLGGARTHVWSPGVMVPTGGDDFALSILPGGPGTASLENKHGGGGISPGPSPAAPSRSMAGGAATISQSQQQPPVSRQNTGSRLQGSQAPGHQPLLSAEQQLQLQQEREKQVLKDPDAYAWLWVDVADSGLGEAAAMLTVGIAFRSDPALLAGIKPQDMPNLFKPFSQLDSNTNR